MNDYDFFSGYKRKKGINLDFNSPYFLGAIILIICVALSVASVARNIVLDSRIDSLTQEADAIKSTDNYLLANELQSGLDAMADYDIGASSALRKFKEAKVLDSNLISSLLKGVPANVTVTSFKIDSVGFVMICDVPGRKAAAELMQGLKETGLCQEVRLNFVTNNPDNSGGSVNIDGILKAGAQQ